MDVLLDICCAVRVLEYFMVSIMRILNLSLNSRWEGFVGLVNDLNRIQLARLAFQDRSQPLRGLLSYRGFLGLVIEAVELCSSLVLQRRPLGL